MMTTRSASSAAVGTWLIVMLSVLACTHVFAAPGAGEVVTVAGRASAATEDGDVRKLGRGAAVNAGDTVVTSSNSYVRMKFIDGAAVVLRPNSRFHIEEYKLAEKEEDNRSFFNLVKGGFRAVTGAIGKRNRRGYRVRTAVATIGIRGTEYEIRTCQDYPEGDCGDNPDGDYYRVHEGEIVAANEAGEIVFEAGDFGYTPGPNMSASKIPEHIADPLTSSPIPPCNCE